MLDQGWASAGQVGDGVDKGATGLWEVNPFKRLSFFQASFLHAFEDEPVLKKLRLHWLVLSVYVSRCQGRGKE